MQCSYMQLHWITLSHSFLIVSDLWDDEGDGVGGGISMKGEALDSGLLE